MEEQSWNLERIQQLVKERIPEDQYLEYKSQRVLGNKSFRDDLSQDVAAFANAGGGTLIIGIDEDKKGYPKKIEGSKNRKVSKEGLSQIFSKRIRPKIKNLLIYSIELKDGNEIYVIDIPESFNGPHMVEKGIYNTRRDATNEVMEHFEVRDVFFRSEKPDIHIDLYFRRNGVRITEFPIDFSREETKHSIELNGVLRNIGGQEIHHVIIDLMIDSRLDPKISEFYANLGGEKHYRDILKINELQLLLRGEVIHNVCHVRVQWGGEGIFPIFKGPDFLLLSKDISIHFMKSYFKNEDELPFILWELSAPSMEKKKGMFEIFGFKQGLMIREKEPLQFDQISKQGVNRQFMKVWDSAINPYDVNKY